MTPMASASKVDTLSICPADLNRDRIVNIVDLTIVGMAWHSYPGHPKWNPRFDLNDDEVVNILDMVLVLKDFGMTWLYYDFDDPLDWNVVGGTWSIMNGSLDGFSNAEGSIYPRDFRWKDCTLTAKVKIATDSPRAEAAFCFRFVDSGNFYWAGLGCWGHKVSISRMVNHVPEELIFSGDEADVIKDVWYNVSIKISGDVIELYVNDVLELAVNDMTFTSGVVGVRLWNSHMLVDYLIVSGFASTSTSPRIITYFNCSFAYEGPEPYSKGDWWPTWEPCGYPNEKGIWHWVVANRPKEPCGGNMRLVDDPADPTKLCLEMVLDYEGTRPVTDDQDVKLYEHQHRAVENYPEPYPTAKEAYYSFKVWFPKDWAEAQDWKLIWQICGEYGVYGTSTGHWSPQMSLFFASSSWGYGDSLVFGMLRYYYEDDQMRRWKIIDRASLPKEKWVTFDIYVKQGSAFQSQDGTVIMWIDGQKVFERHDLPTATPSGTPYVVWSIGNYGSRFEPYGQRILFKDVIASSEQASFA